MTISLADLLRGSISEPRLESYRQPGDSDETMVLNYFWNLELSQALYPLLQAFEISLRNTIDRTLIGFSGKERWFDEGGILLPKQVEMIEKAKGELQERGVTTPPAGKVVAQLMFGFWTSMLNRPFEEVLWHTGDPMFLMRAFPHLPRQRRNRKSIYGRARLANTLRNRVFHYEPIWNRPNLLSEHGYVFEALGWIDPDMCRAIAYYDRFAEIHMRGYNYHRAALRDHLRHE